MWVKYSEQVLVVTDMDVDERTHRHAQILDIIIYRDDCLMIERVSVSTMLYGHLRISIDVS